MIRKAIKAIGNAWCRSTHGDLMWPIKGRQKCKVCPREFPVSWEQKHTPLAEAMLRHEDYSDQEKGVRIA